MRKIKVAVIGIGGYGNNYALPMLDDERVEIVGFADPFPEKTQAGPAAKERGIRIYRNAGELFEKETPELTVVSTPIFCHKSDVLTALAHGSHVLCEKPLCATASDADEIAEARRASGKRVYVGFQWSFCDAILRLKSDILSGRYGRPLEMKTLVLWPRDASYYARSWAGKIALPTGEPVFDSVANNAAAHYLHNMFYLLGGEGEAKAPIAYSAELLRANPIENFDVAKIDLAFEDGMTAHLIAAHPTRYRVDPTFVIRFENATVYYSAPPGDKGETCPFAHLIPEEYEKRHTIIAKTNDGREIDYGAPVFLCYSKIDYVLRDLSNGAEKPPVCSDLTASVHTKFIDRLQKECRIEDVDPTFLKKNGDFLYVEGLNEKMLALFEDPAGDLSVFVKK